MKIATSLAGRVLASTERHVSTQKSITRTAYGFASPVWDHDSLNDRKEPQQNLSACKCHSNRRESPRRFGWQYRNGQPHQRAFAGKRFLVNPSHKEIAGLSFNFGMLKNNRFTSQ